MDCSAPGAQSDSNTRPLKTIGKFNVSSVAGGNKPTHPVVFMISVINYDNQAKSLGKQVDTRMTTVVLAYLRFAAKWPTTVTNPQKSNQIVEIGRFTFL